MNVMFVACKITFIIFFLFSTFEDSHSHHSTPNLYTKNISFIPREMTFILPLPLPPPLPLLLPRPPRLPPPLLQAQVRTLPSQPCLPPPLQGFLGLRASCRASRRTTWAAWLQNDGPEVRTMSGDCIRNLPHLHSHLLGCTH